MLTYGGIWINLKGNYYFFQLPPPSPLLTFDCCSPRWCDLFLVPAFISVKIKDGSCDFY